MYPLAQASQVPPAIEYVPAVQSAQAEDPVEEDFPAAQDTQVPPSAEYVPATQSTQAEDPVEEDFPAAQGAQVVDPATAEILPASHCVQGAFPSDE